MVPGPPHPRRAWAGRPHRLQVLPRHGEHRGDPLSSRYAALLAEGERLVSSAPDGSPTLTEALTALALTCGVPAGSPWLDAAVAAGSAEAERTSALTPSSSRPAVAEATTWVLPAAACALVSTGGIEVDPAPVLDEGLRDVAAALLVVRVPRGTAPADEPPGEGLLLGHALAAGWLATRLWASGVVGAPGTFGPTVAAVVGAA